MGAVFLFFVTDRQEALTQKKQPSTGQGRLLLPDRSKLLAVTQLGGQGIEVLLR